MRYSLNMIILILILIMVIGCTSKTDNKEDVNKDGTNTFNLVWSDEFDIDGAPDPTKWTYENGFVRNQELQWYQPENAFCENGLLIIEGRKEIVLNPNYIQNSPNWRESRQEAVYTSASVTTRGLHTWTYGRFEVKAKIKTREGLWPAIWTIGADQPWPEGGEIDIMEYYGGNILANAAWAGAGNQVMWDDLRKPVSSFGDANWDEKFHIWRMDWTTNSIKLYLDDELLNTIELSKTINQRGSVKSPFKIPHFLILNLAIRGKAGGEDPSGTSFPTRYEIDYVRIYQTKW